MPVNDNHVLIVNENHQVFACGFNSTGQVGIGTETQSVSRLTQIEIPVRILHVSAGLQHSLAVAEDGSLWAFGDNNFGQLGLGIYLRSANTPTKIPETQNFCAISTGGYFSLALDRNGKVWSFGINQYGQLGLGDTVHRHTPELNPHLENITVISAGLLHALALDIHGNIWSFGANANGELGLGDNRLSRHIPAKIPNLHDIQSLSSGYLHNLVLDRNGYVWCFGYNQHGC
jgi:alpha-tubulin suppressor-like RCC1 family protein